jgi:hypothetical protein
MSMPDKIMTDESRRATNHFFQNFEMPTEKVPGAPVKPKCQRYYSQEQLDRMLQKSRSLRRFLLSTDPPSEPTA